MRHEKLTSGSSGPDWKGIGYLVSILSVLLLGTVAWPKPDEPRWHMLVLIAGMATSMLGMGFRYKAHLDERREIKQAKNEARKS